MTLKSISLAVFSALLQIIIFPQFNLHFLAWIFLIPLFFALEKRTAFQSSLLCLLFGGLSAMGNTYWLYPTVIGYFEQPPFQGILFALFIQVVFAGFYFALFGLFYRMLSQLNNHTLKGPLVAAGWVGCEYFRSTLFTGLPWELVAHSQYQNLSLIQIADITGVYGISFIIVGINYSLYLTLRSFMNAKGLTHFNLSMYQFLLIPIVLLVFTLSYGKVRLAEFKKMEKEDSKRNDNRITEPIWVSVIQGNIKSRYRWRSAYYGRNLRRYLTLTKKAVKDGADIIIWPENAINFYLEKEPFLLARIMRVLEESQVHLVIGGPRYEKAGKDQNNFFNSAYYLIPKQGISGVYDKTHLLPFSEYNFFQHLTAYGKGRTVAPKKYSFGQNYTQFPFLNTQFSVLICYEIIYPHLVREFVKRGASFLINISNDSWFGNGAGPYQHLSLSIFRAVEHKLFLVRAVTTGISAFITPTGKIHKVSKLFREEILIDTILPQQETTFYTKYGDLFARGCILLTIIALSYLVVKKNRLKRNRWS